MTTPTELRSCPFCGRQVKIHQDGYYMAPVIRHATSGKDCVFSTLVFYNRSLETAVELWNHRATDKWEDDGR